MSIRRIGAWLAATAVTGVLVALGWMHWVGWDWLHPEHSDPRVLAEGTAGGARWVVVQVRERDQGECLHLRQDGVLVDRRCAASSVLDHYQADVQPLRGASGPLIFAVLPAGAARVEMAADGGDTAPRFRTAALVPLPVRTFGEAGRYLVEPAPAGPQWRDRNAVKIDVYDTAGRRLTP